MGYPYLLILLLYISKYIKIMNISQSKLKITNCNQNQVSYTICQTFKFLNTSNVFSRSSLWEL